MKRLLSILLAAVMLLTASALPVSAEQDHVLIGDVDLDDEVTIVDSTFIQRAVIALTEFTPLQSYLGDVDGSEDTDIVDATVIQRRLLGLSNRFYRDYLQKWRAELLGVSSYPNGNCYKVGTTVHFGIQEQAHEIPSEIEVYLNGALYKDCGVYSDFALAFDTVGYYRMSVAAYDPFGTCDIYTLELQVISSQPPGIKSAYYDKVAKTVRVTASGGTAPYKYSYAIRNNITPLAPGQQYSAEEFDFKFGDDGSCYLYCDFCDNNEVDIPVWLLSKTLTYYCEVQVMDSSGDLSEVKKVQIIL